MGGFGSGDWCRVNRKTTVEESLKLAVKEFRGQLNPYACGKFVWTLASGGKFSVGYHVTSDVPPSVLLHYRLSGAEEVQILVELQTTPTRFGGQRHWFTCPLSVNGKACARRAGKLYLPPGARYFGCRKCHELTYRSSQTAHQEERLIGRITRMLAFAKPGQ